MLARIEKDLLVRLEKEAKEPTVKSKLKFSLSQQENVDFRKKYVGTQYHFLALSVPQERRVFSEWRSSLTLLDPTQRLKLAIDLWESSKVFHVLSQSLSLLSSLVDADLDSRWQRKIWKCAQRFIPKLDNWAHSDSLSSIYAQLLENALLRKDKEAVSDHLSVRTKWNTHKNPWARRQSLVGLLYYAGSREAHLPYRPMIELVDPLIEDNAFYVQRGVGWTLRELYNVYPKESFAYLKKNASRLSAIATSAATEKLSVQDKRIIKNLRKK